MSPRRRLSAAVSAGSLLFALTACERPAPLVTLVSSGNTVHSEAAIYCFEGQSVQQANCAGRADEVKELRVRAGQPIGIDVDKELADGGWQLQLVDAAQPDRPLLTSEPQQENHYYAFDLPELPSGTTLQLTVQALDEAGQPGKGSWQFELVPRTEAR